MMTDPVCGMEIEEENAPARAEYDQDFAQPHLCSRCHGTFLCYGSL
ncbi:MAG: hypothetical protein ABID54_15135 [Pseudomonadota bacterium]